jgi:hypothetical protein
MSTNNIQRAIALLEQSAGPFDEACMLLRQLSTPADGGEQVVEEARGEPWKDDPVVWGLSQKFNDSATWFDDRMRSVAYHAAFEFNPGDAGSRQGFMAGAVWMSGFLEIVLDNSKALEARAQESIKQAYAKNGTKHAYRNASLLAGAAYMAAAEAVRTAWGEAAANKILALTPDSARKELERVCMEVARATDCHAIPLSDDQLRAIVHQVLSTNQVMEGE